VANARPPFERLAQTSALEISELALGAPAREVTVLDGRDPSRIVAAIFETAKRVDEVSRDRLRAKYSNDPAHQLNILWSSASHCVRENGAGFQITPYVTS
jgi:hypothetical protein